MDFSSSSSVPVAAASSSNGNNGDSKSGREAVSFPSVVQVVSGSGPMEDDVALSVAAGLAKEAWLLFRSGKFLECVDVLNQLLQMKENDPKVHHNIAIAESFQDGCSDPKKLLDRLFDLKKRAEELALVSEEQTDVSNTRNKVLSGSKGNQITVQQSSGSSSSPAVSIDKFDTSVTMFNIAVIWFHFHEYAKSFSILDRLYQNIEPIDEGTALRICLLLLDVGLLSYQFPRCADVITYVERVFCINSSSNQVDNGNLAQEQPNMGSKYVSLPSNAVILDSSNPDSSADAHILDSSAHILDSSLTRTLSEEGLEDESLQLLSSLDISGENLSRPRGNQSPQDLSRARTEDSISTIDLRLKLHLHKVCLFLLTRNLKAAKREVKMAMNMARGGDYTLALYLKSQLEYARGNHQKAIKLLMASINRAETAVSNIFLNNLGCIYHQIGKIHTATILFLKALSSSSFLQKEKPPKLLTISQDKTLQMMYNCGVNHLACGKPLLAVRCFQKASVIYYNRPLLWLRIAECCLMALEKGLTKSSHSATAGASNVAVHVIGKGKWRQLAVEDGVSRSEKSDFIDRQDITAISDKDSNLSIPFARQCLLNALHLLETSDSKCSRSGLVTKPTPEGSESADSFASMGSNHKNMASGDTKAYSAAAGSGHASTNGDVRELKGGIGLNMSFMNSISDYEDICRKENQMVKQAILADLAYVELELENPLSALSTAKSLLKLSECSKVYIFLGNVYAAEALSLLNRPKEASEHLYTYVAGDKSVDLPYSQDDIDKWAVEKMVDSDEASGAFVASNDSSRDESQRFLVLKPEDARGTLYANLAALYAMQGDLEQARQVVMQALSIIPDYPEVILTAIYLDLLQGKTHDAIAKLKQCNRIRFVSSNQKTNGPSGSGFR